MASSRLVKLLSYASQGFYRQQAQLNRTAARGGINWCAAWTDEMLKLTEFYRTHRAILDQRRGSGYWLWKPYLISRELEAANNGDFIVYYDVGRPSIPHRFARSLEPLLKWCEMRNAGVLPGVYVPEHGPSTKWTKRECFLLMGCDEAKYWRHPQMQATYSIWQKSDLSLDLVHEWLKWCTSPGVLTDDVFLPEIVNFPDFVDHRHDQSIITNLAIKRDIKCFGDADESMLGSKDINNLVDRVLGRRASVAARTFIRLVERKIRSALSSA